MTLDERLRDIEKRAEAAAELGAAIDPRAFLDLQVQTANDVPALLRLVAELERERELELEQEHMTPESGNAKAATRWQAWVITDRIQRFESCPELFVTDADYDALQTKLNLALEREAKLVELEVQAE